MLHHDAPQAREQSRPSRACLYTIAGKVGRQPLTGAAKLCILATQVQASQDSVLDLQPKDINPESASNFHIRPYLPENTGSRPLSHSQAGKGRISSWVGDDQRIPAVVCFLPVAALPSFYPLTIVVADVVG
jgi:hypothetical protein